MTNKIFSAPLAGPAMIISLGLFLSACVGALTFYQVRSLDDALSVTGSAKTAVSSDSVKWTFNISRRVTETALQSGYASIARDLAATKKFLSDHGIKDEQVTIAPVMMEEIWHDANYQGPREVVLRQSLTLQSSDVAGVTNLAKATDQLANQGVFLSANPPEYYYSKLADLRVSLLAAAVKDAKARAEQLAKSSGQRVGSLKAASSGVVQVMTPNSVEVSDYGSYDTASIEKEVMVTVRTTFFVK